MRFYPAPFDAIWSLRGSSVSSNGTSATGSVCWDSWNGATGSLIGDCGPAVQQTGHGTHVELGWHVLRARQGHGFATEAAVACRDEAFKASASITSSASSVPRTFRAGVSLARWASRLGAATSALAWPRVVVARSRFAPGPDVVAVDRTASSAPRLRCRRAQSQRTDASTPWSSGSLVLRAALVLVAVRAAQLGRVAEDLQRFRELGAAPGIPYRDFQVEYAPLELVLIRLVASHPRRRRGSSPSSRSCPTSPPGTR